MAKVTDVVNTTESVSEQPVETAKQIVDRLDKEMMRVYLRPGAKDEAKSEFVSINGKTWNVPRGVWTPVPRPVFEVLRRSKTAQMESERYEDQRAREFDEMKDKLK